MGWIDGHSVGWSGRGWEYILAEWGNDCDPNRHCAFWVVWPLLWNARDDCQSYRMNCYFCTPRVQWWIDCPAQSRTSHRLCQWFQQNARPHCNFEHFRAPLNCVSTPTASCNGSYSRDSQTQTALSRWHSICHCRLARWSHENAENRTESFHLLGFERLNGWVCASLTWQNGPSATLPA